MALAPVCTAARVDRAPAAVEAARQATGLQTAARVQVVMFTEGSCVQAMHHGAYDQEPKTLARIDRFMQEHGLVANGLHHELYLSDVNETDPAKMRTILRQPVRATQPARRSGARDECQNERALDLGECPRPDGANSGGNRRQHRPRLRNGKDSMRRPVGPTSPGAPSQSSSQ
jgi:GyrI-like small molecule binding domain